MIVNNVLDEIFSRWSNLSVLRALNKYNIGISGREVSRVAKTSIKNCFVALNDLEQLGLVKRIRGGRDHFFSLNRENYLVQKIIIPLFEIENNFVELIEKDLKKVFSNKCEKVFIFGSVIRKEENINSDFDVCLVYKNANQKKLIEENILEVKTYFFEKYNINLSLLIVSLKEFNEKTKSKKPPFNEIISEGIKIFEKKNGKSN
ncbi:MAG: nucleotidyltransferase domain-containing protein [Stygiobacter sp.]|jgi:predicted nucleotidyltransferase|uniref:Nucleotidyltransferase domain-containing protein n=1 Tax=Stygiobacter electus TaxID=3032292 RepID=A0AAE3NWA1_9BACT|nr:nucleotidyltransferase domain-containing protein [Stygiobacter electus]MDF1612086.1 nucleotidyltransferase domain-containing protein [Stygiobacter electus]